MIPGTRAVALATVLALAPPPEGPQPAPGGYWGVGELREPEPKDGRYSLWVGGALLGLGVLRAAWTCAI